MGEQVEMASTATILWILGGMLVWAVVVAVIAGIWVRHRL